MVTPGGVWDRWPPLLCCVHLGRLRPPRVPTPSGEVPLGLLSLETQSHRQLTVYPRAVGPRGSCTVHSMPTPSRHSWTAGTQAVGDPAPGGEPEPGISGPWKGQLSRHYPTGSPSLPGSVKKDSSTHTAYTRCGEFPVGQLSHLPDTGWVSHKPTSSDTAYLASAHT